MEKFENPSTSADKEALIKLKEEEIYIKFEIKKLKLVGANDDIDMNSTEAFYSDASDDDTNDEFADAENNAETNVEMQFEKNVRSIIFSIIAASPAAAYAIPSAAIPAASPADLSAASCATPITTSAHAVRTRRSAAQYSSPYIESPAAVDVESPTLQHHGATLNIKGTAANGSGRYLDFNAVQYAVPNLSEDKGFGVHDFLQMFDDVMYQMQADEIFKLASLRRKLCDTAACLINNPDAITYEGLKAQLIKTFGRRMTTSQAETYVRSRKWKKGSESLLKYVLEMERLRRHLTADRFTETEFVDILLKGMNLPPTYANMLSFPRTIDEFKDRMHRFEDELAIYAMKTPAALMPKPAVKLPPAATADADTRCYNCSKLGHF